MWAQYCQEWGCQQPTSLINKRGVPAMCGENSERRFTATTYSPAVGGLHIQRKKKQYELSCSVTVINDLHTGRYLESGLVLWNHFLSSGSVNSCGLMKYKIPSHLFGLFDYFKDRSHGPVLTMAEWLCLHLLLKVTHIWNLHSQILVGWMPMTRMDIVAHTVAVALSSPKLFLSYNVP